MEKCYLVKYSQRFSPRSARIRRRRRRRRNVSLAPGLPGLTVRGKRGGGRERWEAAVTTSIRAIFTVFLFSY